MGDGLMTNWEIPSDLDMVYQRELCRFVIQIVDNTADRFYLRFQDLADVGRAKYGNEGKELHLGIGLARGHAWRLDFRHSIECAGANIKLASRS